MHRQHRTPAAEYEDRLAPVFDHGTILLGTDGCGPARDAVDRYCTDCPEGARRACRGFRLRLRNATSSTHLLSTAREERIPVV